MVLLVFLGFYWVLLGCTGFCRVLLCFIGFLSFGTGFERVSSGFTEFLWDFLAFNALDWVLPSFTGLHGFIFRDFRRFYWVFLAFTVLLMGFT